MPLEPDSPPPNPTSGVESQPEVLSNRTQNTELAPKGSLSQQALAALASMQSPQHQATIDRLTKAQQGNHIPDLQATGMTLIAIAIIIFGLALGNELLAWFGVVLTLLLSIAMLLPWLKAVIQELFSAQERSLFVAIVGVVVALIGIVELTGINRRLLFWGSQLNWEAFGTLAEWIGALGQILIAVLAVFVAWRQYVISKDLTIQQNLLTVQQNLITQQQTIDSYFQGISELVLDDEGLLEDWPQERALAEGRTAAILGSVDRGGKAKILRFLSSSRLLTPLKRDSRLGRAILNGDGGYAEDRVFGVRVIDLGVMLAGADLSGTDLRWTDLSEANLIRVNLSSCDLVRANFARTILAEAKFVSADLKGTLLFYGSVETASPRSRTEPPNYRTGEYTGAVIENADFTNVQRMSESTRYYCCAWGGEKTRATIPGGCNGIPNKLEK
ncbi:pentapeptide repeat-containing protein [Gloeocapsopsis crepidinum LEGE 06123]|uniref:Pentapeptide repeat-containing protein n=1 Tax=Gloeocapsopsis crepidinum LEGE 06123 TaxID=588587 RepID=A0ABR9US39_9CHRO|nr:pentapeptide repeat-containing protein [Gloeocapsopsis crepidinum]MBE9190873.1 pentapeptide repeat-containing protein [Gloeocapsopsis crepidinum LEGE 06123]